VSFDNFPLSPILLSNVKALGYSTPTPIQTKSIPVILEGQDIMGLAQTGTGKTAAFLLPILHQLLAETAPATKTVRALIIAPTRELAQQIDDSIKALAKNTSLRSVALYGGMKIGGQIKSLRQGVDIVVACPGRLLDHLQQRTIHLTQVKVLVLDEADQMFDMGFLPNIRKILKQLPRQRQTLLFSATMPGAIESLAHEILREPVTVKISRSSTPQAIQHTVFPVPAHRKSEFLIHLLHRTESQSVLVFTRTKHTAKKLASLLEEWGFQVASLQGNLSQSKRQAAMNQFRDGKLKILVATDIASRGIDVTHVSHVINYDIPGTVEAYVHRTGRTGRAARSGEAYTLVSGHEQHDARRIERMLGLKLKQRQLDDFDYRGSSAHSEETPERTSGEHKPKRFAHNKPRGATHGKSRDRDAHYKPRHERTRDEREDESRSPRGNRVRYARDDRDRDRDRDRARPAYNESRPARGKPRYAREDESRPTRGKSWLGRDEQPRASRGKPRHARDEQQDRPTRGKSWRGRNEQDRPARGGRARYAGDEQPRASRDKPRHARDDQSRPARGRSWDTRDDQPRHPRSKPWHARDEQARPARGGRSHHARDEKTGSAQDESRPWHKKRKSNKSHGAPTRSQGKLKQRWKA
jgi:ATP-dependent RNA helicase RhlE